MGEHHSLKESILMQVDEVLQKTDFSDPLCIPELQTQFNRIVDETAIHLYGDTSPTAIHASSVTLTVCDDTTGNLYRRNLPIEFQESDNALRLIGETLEGTPTEIVLLSQTALERIRDLTGAGPDSPRCE